MHLQRAVEVQRASRGLARVNESFRMTGRPPLRTFRQATPFAELNLCDGREGRIERTASVNTITK